jgi:ABC-type phosphate transport system permease subunit
MDYVLEKGKRALNTVIVGCLALLCSSGTAYAQTVNVDGLITKFGTYVVDPILLVIFASGFFMFMWGLFQFMLNISRGEDTADGKRHMIYGTLGMLIMVSVYGIISFLDNTFGLHVSNPNVNTQNISAPTVNFTGSGY